MEVGETIEMPQLGPWCLGLPMSEDIGVRRGHDEQG
jgi:hypothetical protein